ncbi:hypothetical protein SCAR479_13145 [Seiridium cardinale]|uniref:Uncharacterized protein n=1 Tax=Seiridium cardinale TaxID=138064 RepID=A0ABR2X8Y8_9PEZI
MASIFKELKPLMNATFEASESINRTAPILACTQILMIVLLGAIFFALFGLLVTINPDLDDERQRYITPAVRFLLSQGALYGRIAGKVARQPAWIASTIWALLSGTYHAAESHTASTGKENSGKSGGKRT